MKNFINKKRGFSLVEILVYVAILTALSIFVISSIIIMARSFISFSISRDITESGVISLERILREIRTAEEVDIINSVFNSVSGELYMTVVEEGSSATSTSHFYLQNGDIFLKEGSSATQTLTSDNISISKLIFSHIISSAESGGVRVEIEVNGGSGSSIKTKTFYGTAVLRQKY